MQSSMPRSVFRIMVFGVSGGQAVAISMSSSANRSSAVVFVSISSRVTPGAISVTRNLRCSSSITITQRSVMIMSMQRRPVSGSVHSGMILGAPLRLQCSMVTMTLLHACDQVHRAAHALDHLAGDHPVGDVAFLADFHGTKNGEVDVAATNHSETLRRGEEAVAGRLRSRSACRH